MKNHLMPLRAIGFNAGQYGDIIISLVAARVFKSIYTNSHLTYGIAKKYSDISRFILRSPYVDDVHVWSGYDNFPMSDDLNFLRSQNYDIVFNPMPNHIDPCWYNYRHICQEMCFMHGLPIPADLNIDIPRHNSINEISSTRICVNTFGVTNSPKKSLSIRNSRKLVLELHKRGYETLQICPSNHPDIGATKRVSLPYSEAVRFLETVEAIITIDSSLCWAASALNIPILGLYSSTYLPDLASVSAYQPAAGSFVGIEAPNINDIPVAKILESLFSLQNAK